MNGLHHRRSVLAGLAALAPLSIAVPALARARGPVGQWPEAPMRLRRILIRQLGTSDHLSVTRDFALRFVPLAEGALVRGEQIDAAVDAPASLAPLAKIEQARRDDGVYPIRLDDAGSIVAAQRNSDADALEQAIAVSQAMPQRAEAPLELQARQKAFIAQLRAAGDARLNAMPPDLFYPVETERVEEREVALPGGGSGSIAIRYTASRDGASGRLLDAERIVMTRFGGDEKRTVERWSLKTL